VRAVHRLPVGLPVCGSEGHAAAVTRPLLRPLAALAALLVGVGLLAATLPGSGAAASAVRRATVTGVVLRTGACPVDHAERPCPTHPVVGARVTLWRAGQLVGATQSGEQGRFRMATGPGAAVVRARMSFGGYVSRTARVVTLRRGTTTPVRLVLDNGIR
jgi:hypothetical protein